MILEWIFSLNEGHETDEFLSVEITLRRIYYYHLGTTYLPSVCLLIVAEITLMIGDEYFDTTLMVSLTSMLVMYTLYQSVSGSLPQTAYLKSIDVWLLFGLIMPFIVFLFLVYKNLTAKTITERSKNQIEPLNKLRIVRITNNRLKNNGKDKASRKMTVIIPFSTVFFIFIYWGFSLITYYYFWILFSSRHTIVWSGLKT